METLVTLWCHLLLIDDPGAIRIAIGIAAVGSFVLFFYVLWFCFVIIYIRSGGKL
jgi:hypothetical protein